MKPRHVSARWIATAAVIAALYAALTYVSAPLAFGQVQFRLSEVLTVLPYFTPAAIPGLFIGCILGNIASPFGLVDIVCGSAATLLAAVLSRKMPVKWLVPLPPVITNAVIVALELHFVAKMPLLLTALYVGFGEAVVCFGGGIPLLLALEKAAPRLFGSPVQAGGHGPSASPR